MFFALFMQNSGYMNSAQLAQYLTKQMPVVSEFMEFIGARKPAQ